MAAIKSMPPMVGIMAAKNSFVQKLFAVFETFKFVFVGGFWELGVVGDGLEVVVRLTYKMEKCEYLVNVNASKSLL